jgi:hypothetical protein
LNIELLTISTGNIWKLCGLELNDILIQQQLIFTETDQPTITERVRALWNNCEHFAAWCRNDTDWSEQVGLQQSMCQFVVT